MLAALESGLDVRALRLAAIFEKTFAVMMYPVSIVWCTAFTCMPFGVRQPARDMMYSSSRQLCITVVGRMHTFIYGPRVVVVLTRTFPGTYSNHVLFRSTRKQR